MLHCLQICDMSLKCDTCAWRHWYEMWHFRRCKIFSISMQSKTSGLPTLLWSLRGWIKCRPGFWSSWNCLQLSLLLGADVLRQVNGDVQLGWSLPDRAGKGLQIKDIIYFLSPAQVENFLGFCSSDNIRNNENVFLWKIDWSVHKISIHDKLEFWFQFRLLTGRWILLINHKDWSLFEFGLCQNHSLILCAMLIFPNYQPPRLNFVKISPPTL